MNKSAIQKFAIWARTTLMEQVAQRAYQYGITQDGYGEENAVTVNGMALSPQEQSQRRELVREIQAKGYDQVVEEVAYTWFNRFIALRYMEVNNYLPSHIRVFSNAQGAFDPEILKEALHIDLPGLDQSKVAEYIEKNETEALYRYLLLTQCNALNEGLPKMFEHMGGYTELLFPNNILRPDSVLGRMVADIPEEDWTDQVQIIGWLYQYYNAEKHDEVVNINKSAVKREDIPAATQLFTTDWVVRYMVDNSLGRYWLERNPQSKLAEKLEYLVTPKDGTLPRINQHIDPTELTFFDPCMGSGHILVYAFDVLMEIYKECGYSERDAASAIVEHNLFGLDIDPRATQLAAFAVAMKGRQYDRRFLTRHLDLQLYCPENYPEGMEYGALLRVDRLEERPEPTQELTLFDDNYETKLNTWNFRRLLSRKYTIVCTNPPYLNKYNTKLKDFVNGNYKDYSGDLFSVFIYRNLLFCQADGYCGFMTPFVWMFIKTYEKLRQFIIQNKSITTLIQMEYSAFEEATVPICSFVLKNGKETAEGLYFKLSEFKGGMEVQREKISEALTDKNCGYFYETSATKFSKIPGSPIAYWLVQGWFNAY
ncbi:MAG: BREX-1 system adenine-specific DNA-methyltransferase PglX, partial [Oscillospiraceae bacterium]|nr:BREX-1 system adenine-specific DNA-methyltransferase PglX [Oscillospiraceae bacterium]